MKRGIIVLAALLLAGCESSGGGGGATDAGGDDCYAYTRDAEGRQLTEEHDAGCDGSPDTCQDHSYVP